MERSMNATMNAVSTPVYQSIKDTVKSTGLSEYYLRCKLKDGTLPHIKSGQKVFINVPSLLKQLENECTC